MIEMYERVVSRYTSVRINSMHFTVRSAQILSVLRFSPVANRKEQVSTGIEDNSTAVVMPRGEVCVMRGLKNDLLIHPSVCFYPSLTIRVILSGLSTSSVGSSKL